MSTLVNSLATATQLEGSSSQYDGVPPDLENSIRFKGTSSVQAAGVLLRLPQDIIAAAIVIFTRFWIGPEGGSLREFGAKDIARASLYLVTKPSAYPKSPRSIINVFAYLDAVEKSGGENLPQDADTYYISEGTYQRLRSLLTRHESIILRTLGFQTHVALPYTLCINYIQTLEVLQQSANAGKRLVGRAFAHLNSALLSPQVPYLTHQPSALATAAIYLAAREVDVKLPEEEWWEVFDTDREELGFLVVAMLSMEGFARGEQSKWRTRRVPMDVEEVDAEMERRRMLEEGE